MKARGKKILLVTGTLEIIIGLVSILGIVILLMGKNMGADLSANEATRALGGLLILYAIYGLHILGGLLGVIFADRPKHSTILMLFGFLLILMQVYSWTCIERSPNIGINLMNTVVDIIFILIPCYYFYGAVLNYTDSKEKEIPTRRRTTTTTTAASKKTTPVKKQTTTKTVKKAVAPKKKATPKKTTTPAKKTVKTTPAKKKTTTKTVKKAAAPKKNTTTKKTTAKKPAAKKTTTTAKRKTTTKK